MPPIHFQSLTQSLMRLPDVIQQIPDVLRNPAANPLQAAVLLSMALVLVLIVLLTIVLMITRSSDEEALLLTEEGAEAGEAAEEAEAARAMSWLTVSGIIVLVFAAVWIAAGITTSNSEVCSSCHTNSSHAAAKAEDKHASVACVDCHETGGPVARVTVNLVTRIQHVVLAETRSQRAAEYGQPVASDGCMNCHRKQIAKTYTNVPQGVSMSHKEPLAAGAQCVDCHALDSGVVGSKTVGMAPCLRCHDGTIAKAGCSECHVGDPSVAIRPSVAPNAMATVQVPNPVCTGCHKDMTKCNACHGISMPHSVTFKAYAHARQGALDIWFNNGRLCAKCHYTGHNDCLKAGCHQTPVANGHPNPAWATMHQNTPWKNGAKTGCSCHAWNPYDHDGMTYCQICHAKKPANAVP